MTKSLATQNYESAISRLGTATRALAASAQHAKAATMYGGGNMASLPLWESMSDILTAFERRTVLAVSREKSNLATGDGAEPEASLDVRRELIKHLSAALKRESADLANLETWNESLKQIEPVPVEEDDDPRSLEQKKADAANAMADLLKRVNRPAPSP